MLQHLLNLIKESPKETTQHLTEAERKLNNFDTLKTSQAVLKTLE